MANPANNSNGGIPKTRIPEFNARPRAESNACAVR